MNKEQAFLLFSSLESLWLNSTNTLLDIHSKQCGLVPYSESEIVLLLTISLSSVIQAKDTLEFKLKELQNESVQDNQTLQIA